MGGGTGTGLVGVVLAGLPERFDLPESIWLLMDEIQKLTKALESKTPRGVPISNDDNLKVQEMRLELDKKLAVLANGLT